MNTLTPARFHNTRTQRPLDNDDLRRFAPSVFAGNAREALSDKYKFIPTIDIVEAMRKEGFFPVSASETIARSVDRRGYSKHLLRFRQHDGHTELGELLPEVVLINSHDGSSAYQLSAGLFRLVCMNGLIVADSHIDSIRVRHAGNIIDNVIEGTFKILEETPKALEHVQTFQQTALSQPEKEIFASAAAALRWNPEETQVSAAELLRPRRSDDVGDSLWSSFNILQEKIVRGGIRAQNRETHHTARAREIKSVGENVRLNKALWTLAEEMAKLKNAA